jgi:bacillithiol system protein YtxJ
MHPELVPLQHMDDLDALFNASAGRPIVLFKHSHSCGVSAEALDEIVDHLGQKRFDARYAMVTVQTHRALSNAVTQRFGVRHETPQVLLIRRGKVVWSATHFRVTAEAVEAALSAEAVAQ